MGNRRFAQTATSDGDDDTAPPPPRTDGKRKTMKLYDSEEEEEKVEREKKKRDRDREQSTSGDDDEDEDDEVQEDATPIGDVVRVSGKGRARRKHYEAFEYDGCRYDIEDPVLLTPEEKNQKPYVAIIKDITETKDGSMMVTGQWFYRPEEAEKRGGGNWQSFDSRELFYSFHHDEVPAESVMHKCVVHFIPLNKQIPNRKEHPGFIVQKVYDTVERRLFKLTDKDYEDNKQHEIDLLVQKTISRLGDLSDIVTDDSITDREDQWKNRRIVRKKNMSPLDVTRNDEVTTRSGQTPREETPRSVTSNTSEYYNILTTFKALTGETQRDKWLERLLQGIQFACTPIESAPSDDKESGEISGSNHDGTSFLWPDDAVPAVTGLEKAAQDALSSDFQKYNQKLRQLVFNLKTNAVLARRLMNGELEPSKILNMSPAELKEGLTAEEIASKQPEEPKRMQMTDARCKRCNEKKAGILFMYQAGHGSRYQLECTACGNTWYASRDEVSTLTIEGPSSAKNVGSAPLATAKFEDVEKQLASPRDSEKPASDSDIFKKTTEAYMPVLGTQRSFNKPRTEDSSATAKKAG